MKIQNVLSLLFASGVLATSAFSQSEVPIIASSNETIDGDGISGSPWYHNAQSPGTYEQYSISSFSPTAADFGGSSVTSIESMSISYTQANAAFTVDGPIEFFISFDPVIGSGDYSGLVHNSVGTGINDENFSDTPSAQSLGTFTFTQVDSGTVDIYVLNPIGVQDALLAAINSSEPFSIIIAALGETTAATYAGNQSNSYPDSIILTITATSDGVIAPDPALMITGVMDGTLPGGLPKGIELYAYADIPDLSIYGIGSANNGGGTDGIEFQLSGSAMAGDYIYIASEETEFTNVWGFAPDFVSDAANINGDDAVELFLGEEVVDLFGEIDVDGTGMAWEHLDSWAYRTVAGTPDGSFVIENWTFGGVDALDDLDAAGIAAAVPFGSYGAVELPDPALMITGVMDGSLPGGLPKGIELYAYADIPDLSVYGIGSANNGGGTDGIELQLSGSALAGDFIYIGTEETEFMGVWGIAPDFVDDAAGVNGDDAIELFLGDTVIDVFGEIDVDGNGTAWEYLDSWAYRTVEDAPDGTFAIENWTFGGVDALDDLDAAGIAAAVPFGTYGVIILPDPALMITGVMDGTLPGGLPKGIELYAYADIPDLSLYGIGSANNGGGTDGIELQLSGSAMAGDFIYIASEETEFTNVWGFAPDIVGDAANINGDDAVELFLGEGVIDVFGEIDVDGTGAAWEHLDSWAYRTVEGTPDGTFVIENWTFGGVDALDNLDAAGIAAAVPFGMYGKQGPIGTIYIDFGAETTETGWNFFPQDLGIDTPVALIDSTGAASGVSIAATQAWNGVNTNGSPAGLGDIIGEATVDSFYGNDVEFGGKTAPNPAFAITGLNPGEYYSLTIFASRMGVSDNRSAIYTAKGANTVSGEYNSSNNTTKVKVLYNVMPTEDGVISLDFMKSAANNNGSGFIYLGALVLEEGMVDEAQLLPWKNEMEGAFIVSPWFGAFANSTDGWVNHTELLWIYVGFVNDVHDMWVYSLFLDAWVWSNMDTWPWVYNSATSSWVYYFSVPDAGVWEFDFGVGEWVFYPLGT